MRTTVSLLGRIQNLTREQKRLIFLCVDIALLPIALGFASAVQLTSESAFSNPSALAFCSLALCILTGVFATYLKIPDIRLRDYEIRAAGKLAQLAFLLALSFMVLGKVFGLHQTLGMIIVFGNSYFLFTVVSRVAMVKILEAIYRAGHPRERLIIYGADQTGMAFAKTLADSKDYEVLCYADDNLALQGVAVDGIAITRPSQIPHIAKIKQVRKVVIAMPSLTFARQIALMRRFEKLGITALTTADFAETCTDPVVGSTLSAAGHLQLLGRAKVDHRTDDFCGDYRGKNILITGAGGTIGSELCRQLLACEPQKIVLFDSSEFALYNVEMDVAGFASDQNIKLYPILGSVGDERAVKDLFSNHEIDVVFHAAAYKHVPMVEVNALAGLENNVLGTATLAKASHEAGVERFILVSSDKAVRPTNVMGASKRLAEMVIQDQSSRSKTVFSMVRFGNVLGSSGSVVPLFHNQIAQGGPVTVTHRDVTRYFMTVQEASRLVLMAGSFAKGGEVYVLDMGEPVEILDLARRMIEANGCTVKSAENPNGDIEILTTGLRQGEKMHEELLLGEGKITTPHSKIFCAREGSLSELEVAAVLKGLRQAIASSDQMAAREILYGCVEGYSPPRAAAADM